MKFAVKYVALILLSLLVFISCKKLDDEPVTEWSLISRLYVSFSDYQEGSTSLKNLAIVDPADTNTMDNFIDHNSTVKGGGVVMFNSIAGYAFQKSLNDTTIRVVSMDDIYGVPSNGGLFGNRVFSNVTGLAYNYNSTSNGSSTTVDHLLYIAVNAEGSNSQLYMVRRPGNRSGYVRPDKQISLGAIAPTSLTFMDRTLLMGFSRDGSDKGEGFAVYPNVLNQASSLDTIIGSANFQPSLRLYVTGKTNLGGVSYAPNRDLLAVTAYDGSGSGEILVFENASSLISGTGESTITPSYVISGTSTGLVSPRSVTIDDRLEEGQYIYVADASSKKVSRFLLTDRGNVAPQLTKTFGTRTPVSISLDARSRTDF